MFKLLSQTMCFPRKPLPSLPALSPPLNNSSVCVKTSTFPYLYNFSRKSIFKITPSLGAIFDYLLKIRFSH